MTNPIKHRSNTVNFMSLRPLHTFVSIKFNVFVELARTNNFVLSSTSFVHTVGWGYSIFDEDLVSNNKNRWSVVVVTL